MHAFGGGASTPEALDPREAGRKLDEITHKKIHAAAHILGSSGTIHEC